MLQTYQVVVAEHDQRLAGDSVEVAERQTGFYSRRLRDLDDDHGAVGRPPCDTDAATSCGGDSASADGRMISPSLLNVPTAL